jgi:hypothetical protein
MTSNKRRYLKITSVHIITGLRPYFATLEVGGRGSQSHLPLNEYIACIDLDDGR